MLKLVKLSLQGFGCFKDKTEFDYSDGINLIIAENGKGKSTQLNCIEMLLLDNYEGNFADYLNTDCNEFEVSLEFYIDNYHLLETLSCVKAKTSCTTTRNLKNIDTDEDIANGEKVKEWLNKYLPIATSKYALFVRQNSHLDIINCTDSERRELFKKIQDLDYTSEIKTLIDPKIETTKQSIIDVDKEIFALENKEYEVKDYVEIPFSEDEYKLKKTKLEKLLTENALREEKKKRFEELLEKKESVMNNLTEVNNSISSKKSKIEDYENTIKNSDIEKDNIISKCEENKAEIKNTISSLNEQLNNLDNEKNDKIKECNDEIKNTSKEVEELTKQFSEIKLLKLIKFDENLLIKTRNDLSELKTKSSISWSNAEKIKGGICPVCGSTNCSEKYEELKDQAIAYDKMICECEGAVDDLVQKKTEYEENVQKNQENKELKTTLQGKIDTKNSKLESLKESLSNIDNLYESKTNELKTKIANLEQKYHDEEEKSKSDCKAIDDKCDLMITQKKELEDEIKNLSKKIEDLNKEVSYVNTKIDEFEKSEDEEIDTSLLESEIKSYDDAISQNKIIQEYNDGIEETKKKDKLELEELKTKKQKFEDEKFNLESAKKVMSVEYPNWFIVNSLQNIENSLNEFINEVYYKELNVHFEQTKTGIRMEYGNGLKVHRLSGAETSICNVSFASTFSHALDLGCILLDEIDSPIHDSLKPQFADTLLNMNGMFEQIFIISHDQKFRDYILANNGDCNIINL